MVEEAISNQRLQLTAVDADFVAETQAAGFRHRREGLAYRLTWARRGVRPIKRVAPSRAIPLRRRLIYRARALISALSHQIFAVSREQ
jgi:hypothetical protein